MGAAVLVSAAVGGGKTTSCLRLLGRGRSLGLKVGGVVSPRRFDAEKLVGYDCIDCLTGERYPLARLPGFLNDLDWERFDGVGYLFSPDGLAKANRAIEDGAGRQGLFTVIVDEVGKLEVSGRGFAGGLQTLMTRLPGSDTVAVLSCRNDAVCWARESLDERGVEVLGWSPSENRELWATVVEARRGLAGPDRRV